MLLLKKQISLYKMNHRPPPACDTLSLSVRSGSRT